MKLSIIVPLFNQEKYITKALKSIKQQDFSDYEVIIVNDGSTDKSVNKLKRFLKDQRFHLFNSENYGYGHAMNKGIELAKGDYIGILEPDDYILKDMFKDLYNVAIKNDADVVKSDFYSFVIKKHRIIKKYVETVTDGLYESVLNWSNCPNLFNYKMNTWTGIYKRLFLLENNIKYNETPGASYQDNGFWFQTMSLAKKIVFINKAYYMYRNDNPNSSINNKGKLYAMNREYEYIFKSIDPNSANDTLYKNFYVKKFYNYFYTYNRIADNLKSEYLFTISEEFKKDFNSKTFKLSYFNEWERSMFLRLIDNYNYFFETDTLYRLDEEMKKITKELDLIKSSRSMRIGNAILKPFKIIFRRPV